MARVISETQHLVPLTGVTVLGPRVAVGRGVALESTEANLFRKGVLKEVRKKELIGQGGGEGES